MVMSFDDIFYRQESIRSKFKENSSYYDSHCWQMRLKSKLCLFIVLNFVISFKVYKSEYTVKCYITIVFSRC